MGFLKRPTDKELEKYVLGFASPEAVERIDEAAMADDDTAARLQQVEDDLIDAYVRGTLAGPSLARFRSHFLATPRRRARVAFAAQLARALDRAAASRPQKKRRARTWILSIAAVAAAALLALAAADAPLDEWVRRSAQK